MPTWADHTQAGQSRAASRHRAAASAGQPSPRPRVVEHPGRPTRRNPLSHARNRNIFRNVVTLLLSCLAILKHSRDVVLHPLRECLNVYGQLPAKRCQAVLNLGWFGRMYNARDKSICLERMKRMREHAFTHPSNPPRKLAKAMRFLQQHDQDQRTPARSDVVEDAARGAIRGIEVVSHDSSLQECTYLRKGSHMHYAVTTLEYLDEEFGHDRSDRSHGAAR